MLFYQVGEEVLLQGPTQAGTGCQIYKLQKCTFLKESDHEMPQQFRVFPHLHDCSNARLLAVAVVEKRFLSHLHLVSHEISRLQNQSEQNAFVSLLKKEQA